MRIKSSISAVSLLVFSSPIFAGNDIELITGTAEINVNSTYYTNSSNHQTLNDSAKLGVDNLFPLQSNTITTGSGGANSQLGDITINADISFNGVGDDRNTSPDSLTLNALNDIIINNKIYDGLGSNDAIRLYLNPDTDSDANGEVLLNSSIGKGLSTEVGGQLNIGSTGAYNLIDSKDSLVADSIVNTPGGAFNFTNGTLVLTGSGLSIDSTGLLGATVNLSPTMDLRLNNNNVVTIDAAGSLSVNGGDLRVGQIDNSAGGAFSFTSGQLELTNDSLAVQSGGLLGNTVLLDITKTLRVSGAMTIDSTGSVDVSGGFLSASSIDNSAGGAFNFTSGAVYLTNSGMTIDTSGLLGNNVSINNNMTLSVSDVVTVGATGNLDINGGYITADSIDNSAGGSVNYISGDLALLNSGMGVGSAGLLGSNLSILSGDSVSLRNNNVLTIDATGSVVLDGGTLRVGSIANNTGGNFSFNSGLLWLDNAGVNVDENGLLGNSLTIEAGKGLTIDTLTVGNGTGSTDVVTQTGGYVRANNGVVVQSGGEYNISGGQLDVDIHTSSDILVNGSMTQSGGNVSGANNDTLTIAAGGTYILDGGNLGIGFIDRQAGGTFIYNGGSFSINNDIVIESAGLLGDTLDVTAGKNVQLNNLTIGSAGTVVVDGGRLTVLDGLTKNAGGTLSFISGDLDLGNSNLVIASGGLIGASVTLGWNDKLTANGISISDGGSLILNSGSSVEALSMGRSSAGVVSLNGGALHIAQSTTVTGTYSLLGNIATISAGSLLVDNVMTIDSGSSLTINGGFVAAGSINAVGNFAFNAGSLQLNDNITIGTGGLLGQNVTLDGMQNLNVNIYGQQADTGTITINSGSSNKLTLNNNAQVRTDVLVNNSVLDMNDSSTLIAGRVNNNSSVNIDTNASMTVSDSHGADRAEYIQHSGSTVVDGTLYVDGVVSIEAGTISGSGTLNADLVIGDGAILMPGSSPGTLEINGNLDMLAGSILELEIGSNGMGGYLFDQLFVSGDYNLQGSVWFSLLDGVDENIFESEFNMGDFFKDAGGIGLTDLSVFNNIDILAVNGANWFAIELDPSGTFISSPTTSPVPVPAAVWLFVSGLIGLIGVARCKKA